MSITTGFRGVEFNLMVMRGASPPGLEPAVMPFPENKKNEKPGSARRATLTRTTLATLLVSAPHHLCPCSHARAR